MINPERFYTMREIHDLSKEGLFPIATTSLYKMIKEGKIKAFQQSIQGIKPRYKILGKDLLLFIDSASSLEIQNVNRRRDKKKKS
jgi:hypothetical protein